MSRKGNTLTFRLRKIDADLTLAIGNIDNATLSDLCRDGLRFVLGMRTTRRIEVTERPIAHRETAIPQSDVRRTVDISSKPAVFVPPHKRA